MTNKIPTEDHIKQVEQDDRIIQFDAGEVVKDYDKFITQFDNKVASADVLRAIEKLDEESKRTDRFCGMRLNKSTDDIENTFLVMFAEFVSLMAILIGVLGFGILLWAIFS